ncbi:hypothetical protein JXA56_04545 [Candidatus Micrarchaeota archaeon]|nr:hypothetical protein [Candidatus Micrarchaeota archaeon]
MRKRMHTLPSTPASKNEFSVKKPALVALSMNLLERHLNELNCDGWQSKSLISENDVKISVEFIIDILDPKARELLIAVAEKTPYNSVSEIIKSAKIYCR